MTSNFKIFKGDFCIPEAQYTAREDSASVAVVVLKTAIKDAPNKEGAKMLTCNNELFDAALKAAEASLVRIYDPDLFPAFASSDNCTFAPSTSTAPAADTIDTEDNSEFPF